MKTQERTEESTIGLCPFVHWVSQGCFSFSYFFCAFKLFSMPCSVSNVKVETKTNNGISKNNAVFRLPSSTKNHKGQHAIREASKLRKNKETLGAKEDKLNYSSGSKSGGIRWSIKRLWFFTFTAFQAPCCVLQWNVCEILPPPTAESLWKASCLPLIWGSCFLKKDLSSKIKTCRRKSSNHKRVFNFWNSNQSIVKRRNKVLDRQWPQHTMREVNVELTGK